MYEFHLTFDPKDKPQLLELQNIGIIEPDVKFLHFANTLNDGTFREELIASWRRKLQHYSTAIAILQFSDNQIRPHKPLRRKLETVPWHSEGGVYFETHLKLLGSEFTAKFCGCLISRNILTRSLYATVRTDGHSFDRHMSRIHQIAEDLSRNHVSIIGFEHEKVLFDNNRDLDKGWETL